MFQYVRQTGGDIEDGMRQQTSSLLGMAQRVNPVNTLPQAFTSARAMAEARARDVQAMTDKLSADNVKYFQSTAFFKSNLMLAIAVGVYTALFTLPTYVPYFDYQVFGTRTRTVNILDKYSNITSKPVCGDEQVGRYINIALEGEHYDLIHWNATLPAWNDEEPNSVWCGYFVPEIQMYMGNAAQMIIFTVYMNTGTTIQLGWQGMIGTMLATFNAWAMTCIFDGFELNDDYGMRTITPCADLRACNTTHLTAEGGACPDTTDFAYSLEVCKERGPSSVYVYPSSGKRTTATALIWANITLLLMAFLFSGAAENTMKFGMSWAVYFQMRMLNPAWVMPSFKGAPIIPHLEMDSEFVAVVVTSLMGVLIAILATLVNCSGRPLTNTDRVDDDALAVTNAVNDIFRDAVDYFSGTERTAKRFQIREKILALNGTVVTINGNLTKSWWETFDVGHFKDKRSLLGKYDDSATSINEALYGLKSVIMQEDFGGRHAQFVEKVGPSIEELKGATTTLINDCCTKCSDGTIDDDEYAEIEEQIELVQQRQSEVLKAMHEMPNALGKDLSNEHVFTYALSDWADKVISLASGIKDHGSESGNPFRACFSGMMEGCDQTFNPRKTCMNYDHAMFAIRNTVSIMICFFIGAMEWGSDSLFDAYSGTMASTLALLISHFQGSAMQNNLNRLIGVVMGKALPILLISAISIIQCDGMQGYARVGTQFSLIAMFVFVFCYMYYTSAQFSLVGCLIAGFGTPMLMVSCLTDTTGGRDSVFFAERYKEIGQVTFAIIIQTIVDFAMTDSAPRDMATKLTGELVEGLNEGYKAFFNHDLDSLCSNLTKAQTALASAEALKGETDPKLNMVRGSNLPFKHTAYLEALESLGDLVADLRNIKQIVTDKDEEGEEDESVVFAHVINAPSMKIVEEDLTKVLEASLHSLQAILTHKLESVDISKDKAIEKLQRLRPNDPLAGCERLYSELSSAPKDMNATAPTEDFNIRVCVLLMCLNNAKTHAGTLATSALGNIIS